MDLFTFNYVALILDSRHKLEAFDLRNWSKAVKTKSYEKFKKILKTQYDSNDFCSEDIGEADLTWTVDEDDLDVHFYALYVRAAKLKRPSWEAELEKYLNSSRPDDNANVLNYWKAHEKEYPRIAGMFRDHLSYSIDYSP